MYLPFRTSMVETGPKFRREEPYGEPFRSEKGQFAIHEVFQAFLHRRNDAYSHNLGLCIDPAATCSMGQRAALVTGILSVDARIAGPPTVLGTSSEGKQRQSYTRA